MDLYVRLWPVWIVLAVLMVNLFVSLMKAIVSSEDAGEDANVFDIGALLTALALAFAAVINVVICLLRTIKGL